MGASSHRHNNPFRAQGLLPGLSLRLEVAMEERVESFATRVEEVAAEHLAVLVPMMRLEQRPIASGTPVQVAYVHNRRPWRFASQSKGSTPGGEFQLLGLPTSVESLDRRRAFRLHTPVRPLSVYRLLVDPERVEEPGGLVLPCTITDLSEGGVSLSSRASASVGEWLGLHIELPGGREVRTRMRAVLVQAPAPGNRNFRIHCVFADISRVDADAIGRYLISRQLQMRRGGQL
jgi:c-di-GMP-binding flagellar brake protein YcgR